MRSCCPRTGCCSRARRTSARVDAEHLSAVSSGLHGLARGAGAPIRRRRGAPDHHRDGLSLPLRHRGGRGACLAVLAEAEADAGMVAYEMEMLVSGSARLPQRGTPCGVTRRVHGRTGRAENTSGSTKRPDPSCGRTRSPGGAPGPTESDFALITLVATSPSSGRRQALSRIGRDPRLCRQRPWRSPRSPRTWTSGRPW